MKIFKNCIQILIGSILIGYFLLSLAYTIPTTNMKSNLSSNIKILDKRKFIITLINTVIMEC